MERLGKVMQAKGSDMTADGAGGSGQGSFPVNNNGGNSMNTTAINIPSNNPGPNNRSQSCPPQKSDTIESLDAELVDIESALKMKTRSGFIGRGGGATFLTSENQFLTNVKRWHPGQDGDFHLAPANPGYGRTPYGGHFTNYR